MRRLLDGRRPALMALAVSIGLVFVFGTACSSDDATAEADAQADQASADTEELADPASFPEVVADVNGTEITKSELIEQVLSIEARGGGPTAETTSLAFYKEMLNQLVGAELLFQESKVRNLAADAAQVDGQIDEIRGRFPGPEQLEQALAAQGMTIEKLRAQIERDMSIQKLIETDLVPSVTVSDADKRQFYDENTERMTEPEQLRLSHILKRVDPAGSPVDRENARVALESVLEQARSGGDFAALAREHSEDPGSAPNGGEMMVSRGQTVPPFEQAAFALEPGGVSDVVETQFGFHIIKLSDRIAGRKLPFEEVQERLGDVVKQSKIGEAIESTVESLKGSGDVKIFI